VTVPPAAAEPEAVEESEAGEVGPIVVDRGWATFHGGPARTGLTAATPLKRPHIRWKTRVGIQGWLNSPLALGALAIVPSSGKTHNVPDPEDGIYALDMKSGRRVWRAATMGDANGVLATDDRVVATSDDGHVYAFDLRSGKQLWKQAAQGKVYSHPLRVADRVIVGDASGTLRALALKDGKSLWTVQLSGAIRGGASADDKQIYAVSQSGEAIALRPDGKQVWKQRVLRPSFDKQGPDEPIEAYAPPVVSKDSLFVSFARDTYYEDAPALLSIDKRTGRVRWRAKGPGSWGNLRSTPVMVGGLLVWGEAYSGDVAAVHETTGRMAYRATIGPCYFPQWASPAAAGDVVYLPKFDGALYALRAKDGRKLWELYLGDSKLAGKPRPVTPPSRYGCEWDVPSGTPLYAPVAVAEDGTVLVGSAEGYLYAIDSA
jgi:outer membrane protein assembly factor BamB